MIWLFWLNFIKRINKYLSSKKNHFHTIFWCVMLYRVKGSICDCSMTTRWKYCCPSAAFSLDATFQMSFLDIWCEMCVWEKAAQGEFLHFETFQTNKNKFHVKVPKQRSEHSQNWNRWIKKLMVFHKNSCIRTNRPVYSVVMGVLQKHLQHLQTHEWSYYWVSWARMAWHQNEELHLRACLIIDHGLGLPTTLWANVARFTKRQHDKPLFSSKEQIEKWYSQQIVLLSRKYMPWWG